MSREVHVPFYERLGVQFPRPTHRAPQQAVGKMTEGPVEVGCQEPASNHPKRLALTRDCDAPRSIQNFDPEYSGIFRNN